MSAQDTQAPRHIALVTTDAAFAKSIRAAFATADGIGLSVIEKRITEISGDIHNLAPAAAIIDVEATRLEEIAALRELVRRLESRIPIIVVTQQFDAAAVRSFIQLQVTDFLTKPVTTADLVRAAERAMAGPSAKGEAREAQIVTFMPAAGGVGTTTLALQAASLFHKAEAGGQSTCVVDLNFQQGSCAEYLDLEPRFDISEIESNPDRLDWQLLDVMLSKHESGICVLASPMEPTEMRNFDTGIVVRLLDLAAAYFDNVVIDLPRTWFPWTETVMLGSNRLYIVAEMTVPCLRNAQRLIHSVEEKVGREVVPKVIVNRFDERASGLKHADLEKLLGPHLGGCVANNYKLVREAMDRGVLLEAIDPRADVIADIGEILLPNPARRKSGRLIAMPKFLKRLAG